MAEHGWHRYERISSTYLWIRSMFRTISIHSVNHDLKNAKCVPYFLIIRKKLFLGQLQKYTESLSPYIQTLFLKNDTILPDDFRLHSRKTFSKLIKNNRQKAIFRHLKLSFNLRFKTTLTYLIWKTALYRLSNPNALYIEWEQFLFWNTQELFFLYPEPAKGRFQHQFCEKQYLSAL